MAEPMQTIPSEQQSTGSDPNTAPVQADNGADKFFGSQSVTPPSSEASEANKQVPPVTPPVATPEPAADPAKAEKPAENPTELVAPASQEVSYQGDDKVTDDTKTWFEPGRYKTRDDAIKNLDKSMGGFARKVDEFGKKIEQAVSAAPQKPAEVNPQDINPDTGQAYTPQEIKDAWTNLWANDPVEAQRLTSENEARKRAEEFNSLRPQIAAEIKRDMTWDSFLAQPENVDMRTQENIAAMNSVLLQLPFVANKADALIQARGIVKSEGADLGTKYQNWLLSKGNGKPAPVVNPPTAPNPLPGVPPQGGVQAKGGASPAKLDPFFHKKDGSSIYSR